VALVKRVFQRVRSQEAFGLIELVIAMAVLNVGVLALVAAFSSGQVALGRASRTATAAALADTQLELYRALKWDKIALDQTAVGAVDTTYMCDVALGPLDPCATTGTVTRTDCTGSPLPNECLPSRTATGADGKTYRVDTYITTQTVTSGRDVRRVTVVVRHATDLAQLPWARQSSDFDQSTAS
jgi:type II secretory pathway pseudopilin PulG